MTQSPPSQVSSTESLLCTIVRAARMLDVRSGELIKNVVVVVEKDRIQSVNTNTPVQGAQQLDLGEMLLLPGLIDMHTHLSYDWESLNSVARDTPADAALRGARNARATLLAGFTTVRNVGAHDFVDVALMRAIDAGFIDGPRIIPVGHSLSYTGGYHDFGGGIFPCFAPGRRELGPESGIADGPDAPVLLAGDNAKEFAVLVELGMTPLEAIRAATLYATELVGVEDRGVIEPGRLADMIAVPGDPLADIHALEDVRFVMQGGRIVKKPF